MLYYYGLLVPWLLSIVFIIGCCVITYLLISRKVKKVMIAKNVFISFFLIGIILFPSLNIILVEYQYDQGESDLDKL